MKILNSYKYIQSVLIVIVIQLILPNSLSKSYHLQTKDLQSSIEAFEKKHSHNQCILDTISSLHSKCEKLDDKLKSTYAFRMTKCFMNKINKDIGLTCNENESEFNCIRNLKDDGWSTFLSFLNQIDNTCIYYKLINFEEGIESAFDSLLSNSYNIISVLEQSRSSTYEMIQIQKEASVEAEKLYSSIAYGMNELSYIGNKSHEMEMMIKSSMNIFKERVELSDRQFEKVYSFIDDKLNLIYGLHDLMGIGFFERYGFSIWFYVYIISFVVLCYFLNILSHIRIILILEIIVFYLIELYLVKSYESNSGNSGFSLSLYFLINIVRAILITIFLVTIGIKLCLFNKKINSNERITQLSSSAIKTISQIDSRVSSIVEEFKGNVNLNMTPIWMRKYISKINYLDKKMNNLSNVDCKGKSKIFY